MASKIDADWTKELSFKGENCPKHSGFTLDYVCKRCRRNVCVRCVALDHSGHAYDIDILKTQTEQISELRENFEERKREVKIRINNCQEMTQKVHETSEERLCSIDRDRDRRRLSVELERSDFERRAKSMMECLEEEENKMYALEYSIDAALSTKQEAGEENTLSDIQEKLEKCTRAQLPRIRTYNDLKVKFERMQSPNRFSSSSITNPEELPSTSFLATSFTSDDRITSVLQPGQPHTSFEVRVECFSQGNEVQPFTSTCRRQSENQGLDREQAQSAVEMEHSKDESDRQGDMDTGSGSDSEGMGAEGGLAFKSDRGVIKGQLKEDEKGNDAHSGKDDLILSDLARHLLPEHLTPLGLNLRLSNVTIKHIRCDNVLDIGNAIYEVLQEWKGTLSAGCLTEEHFKKLEQCLRKIGNEDAADWLIERLQKSTDQLGQPSSSPGKLVQPSSTPCQLVQPITPAGQLGLSSSSAGQLMQPFSSAGQLGLSSSSAGQLGLSSSSAGQLVQSSSTPAQLMQPFSSAGQLGPSSSSADQLVQPSPSTGQLMQPSSSDSH